LVVVIYFGSIGIVVSTSPIIYGALTDSVVDDSILSLKENFFP